MKLLFNYSDFHTFPLNVCFSTLRLLLIDNFDGVYKDTNGKLIAVFDYHETEREQRIIRSASSFLEIYGYDLKDILRLLIRLNILNLSLKRVV